MENLNLNVDSCVGKFYVTQTAVCKEKQKHSIHIRGRQRNKWQAGVQLVDDLLEFCAGARHSIRELQPGN